ncbi:MAG: AMP-binding protein, partial [Acidobacteria bacterium]|nr:AMP-binding protein [Acidobacteriota bacterium]
MIWQPSPEFVERTNVMRLMRRLGFTSREAFLRYSTEHLEEFWGTMAREAGIAWFEPYQRVLDESRGPEWARWFIHGKLNIVHNCVDRHPPERIACIWEGEDGATRTITFAELRRDANRLANYLRGLGLVKGDRVAMLMPMAPEILTILYGCLKLGLIVTPIFAGFGTAAIAARLEDSGARVVFTAPRLTRRGQALPLIEKITTPVEHVLICTEDLLRGQPDECETLPLDSEDPALLLYTSGTTGRPKGVVHTHAGALAQVTKEIWLAFDHQDTDRFFWLSDIGWMMGPWSILGNHHFGGTVFMYDGAPDYPTADRLWQIIERHRITTLGISPTAIRLLMRHSRPEASRLDSLRLLGSTGEPWDDRSWLWYFERAGGGRCPVINISGGTEI